MNKIHYRTFSGLFACSSPNTAGVSTASVNAVTCKRCLKWVRDMNDAMKIHGVKG